MMPRTHRPSLSGALALLAGVVISLAGAGPALAGTFTVNADPATGTGCDLLSPNGGLSQFYYGCDGFAGSNVGFGYFRGEAALPAGSRIGYQMTAPPGISIYAVQVSLDSTNINDGMGWGGGGYWSGGGDSWSSTVSSETDGPFNSPYWGFQMICGAATCSQSGAISVDTVQLVAVENQGPSLTAVGSGNLWYQTGRYVWNPPGDPWPITLQASDPSGVCSMGAFVNGVQVPGPSATPNTAGWQQCPDPTWTPAGGASVDTHDYVPGAGPLSLTLEASNAAGVYSQPSETLEVDNDPVGVSLSTPDDPNPSVWVNHPVIVDATASAGPSGVAGMNCSVDGAAPAPYPSAGVVVNGSGVHTVTCTAWNRAIDPQGSPNTGSASTTIHIDATPPLVAFEPQDPGAPDQLTVDTSDSQSGVAGGSIQIAPAGTSNWTALATSFDGRHLLATLDDAGLHGAYTILATACDNVDNCASTTETLTLPLRLSAVSDVSFIRIDAPAKVVRERVLVDFRYQRERRHHHLVVRVKVGGHFRTVRVVIRTNARCGHTRVKTARRRWRQVNACRVLKLHTVTTRRVAHGKPFTLHGLVVTSAGVPLADAPVSIQTAVNDGKRRFAQAASVTTDSAGEWTVKIGAGPSRIIHAVYSGSQTILPATGAASVNAPAKLLLSIAPRVLLWSNYITISGHLKGGYVPRDGVALRLLVRYPGTKRPTSLQPLRTDRHGRFSFTWSYHSGQGVATYRLWIATTGNESDYPFAASRSRAIPITFR